MFSIMPTWVERETRRRWRSIAEPAKNNIVDLKNARVARTSRATDSSVPARPKRALSPFLIFAGMVAILAVIKFAFG